MVLELRPAHATRHESPTGRAYRLQRFSNSGTYCCTHRRIVVWDRVIPRSAIIWTRSRKLSLNVMYHLTHRMMISWSKCRPLNRSCAEVGSVIPAVIAGCRAFQQFAPELFLVRYILFQMNQQTYARSNNPTNRNC